MNYGRLFLDSANLEQASAAAASGVVCGITTNPSIIHAESMRGPEQLCALLDAFPNGPIFYQLTGDNAFAAFQEIEDLDSAVGERRSRVILKLAAQPWLYSFGAQLVAHGREVAFTAVFDAGQTVCAVEAGAKWIIPYVDRATRLDADQGPIVPRLAPFVPDHVVLLAASIKSASQGLTALAGGAAAITASWAVLQELMSHALTDSAVEQFRSLLAGP